MRRYVCGEPAARSERAGAPRHRDAAFDYGIAYSEKMAGAEDLADQRIEFLAQYKISDELKQTVLQKLNVSVDPNQAERQRTALLRQFERAKKLYLMGDSFFCFSTERR